MAQVTGTTDSYQQGGLREDLWDVITNISPMERPFTSNIDRITATRWLLRPPTSRLKAMTPLSPLR